MTYSCITSDNNILSDISHKIAKTPVTLLQEICTKAQIEAPVYEVISVEGLSHEPSFEYQVTIGGDINGTGKGNSKRKAKHSAALAVLNQFKAETLKKNEKFHRELGLLL